MTEKPQITIEGTTTENTTGPYGEKGCDETLHAVIDGEDVYVPFNNVRKSGYDFRGPVPDSFDVDRVIVYDGRIGAEGDVDGGVVEIVPDYNTATGEFQGHDRWELEFFDADSTQEGSVVYEREN